MRIIKRYKNRRLYDTESKEEITFEDVQKLIKKGEEFKVLDNETNKDITLLTLVQVLTWEIKEKKISEATFNLIQETINLGGVEVMDTFKKAVLAGLGLIDLTREKAEQIVDDLVKKGEVSKLQKSKFVEKLIEGHEEGTKILKEKMEKAKEKLPVVAKEEIEKLHQKIDKLSEALTKLEQKLEKK